MDINSTRLETRIQGVRGQKDTCILPYPRFYIKKAKEKKKKSGKEEKIENIGKFYPNLNHVSNPGFSLLTICWLPPSK